MAPWALYASWKVILFRVKEVSPKKIIRGGQGFRVLGPLPLPLGPGPVWALPRRGGGPEALALEALALRPF